jgi:hypothetical protein
MNKIILLFAILTSSMLTPFNMIGQEIKKDKITVAIEKADAKTIAGFFDDKVELGILDIKNFYSKEQAEVVLKNFFKENPPTSFIIQHKGGKATNGFSIGIYKSGENSFRIYYHIREKNNKTIIPLFKVEKNKR